MTSSNTYFSLFQSQRPFPLDDFQVSACNYIESGRGVLVCAPTGAGKTIVGEFAIFLALRTGGRCFYTTPIKALSNQKYAELVAAYDEDTVGLLTGDVTINPEAEIVVMTTEVLRNMIYADSDNLDRLAFVVMDEIHYLSDKSRGAVWEEVILNLDDSVKIIGLSATVSNSEEFGEWMSTVRGDTEVVVTDHRPIPLTQYAMVGHKLIPLFNREGGASGRLDSDHLKVKVVNHQDAIKLLAAKDMLPAIFFIFSRNGCERAMRLTNISLTTKQERAEITRMVEKAVADIPPEDLRLLGYQGWLQSLKRGIAAHHAGMLPAFRHVVEKLFERGLLKVVFATETLALGINMPARTVFLDKLVKYNGEAHVPLTPGQYTQLTGRAGRRGIDTQGNAVVQWRPEYDAVEVANMASTRTYPLISTFSPSYNMSVNLLKTLGFDKANQMIDRSFAQFQANKELVAVAAELADLRKEEARLHADLIEACQDYAEDGPMPLDEGTDVVELYEQYMALRQEQAEEEQRGKELAQRNVVKEIQALTRKLRKGDVLALPGRNPKRPLIAVVLAAQPETILMTTSGHQFRLDPTHYGAVPFKLGFIRTSHNTGTMLRNLRQQRFPIPRRMKNRVPAVKTARLSDIRRRMAEHPVHYWRRTHLLDQLAFQLQKLRRQIDSLQSQVDNAGNNLTTLFNSNISLLQEIGYIDENLALTEDGMRLTRIHNDADLLMAECLRRQVWADLDPAELAGIVSLCCFESRGAEGRVEFATHKMDTAFQSTMRIWDEIISNERRWNLPETQEPDPSFALILHQWTAGAPLDYCMKVAQAIGLRMTPGDFVRQCRIVVDNLEQVRQTTPTIELRARASQAIDAIKRGVVEL
ncbi:MAG: DEAD/DEAH box helicase [Corynebacterium sp.]|nr:DEAD/DEAH box helicase [Corynebacterium sp.]